MDFKFSSYIRKLDNGYRECTLCGNDRVFFIDREDVVHCGECHGTGEVIKDMYKEANEV